MGVDVIFRASPNFEERKFPIKYIVLHGTWMETCEAALERLCCAEAKVSCHYVIDEKGFVYQLVDDERVAWHAGISAWGKDVSLNQNSIGIEMANVGGGAPYTESQYKSLILLLEKLISKHKIQPENVLGHSDIAPDRKDDPGYAFDWDLLYKSGVSKPFPLPENPTAEELRAVGYVGSDDVILKAYHLRLGKVLA